MKRPIIFFHIPKCAGSSVNRMVDHAIRLSSTNYSAPRSEIWDCVEDPLVFCERALDADYVSGHLSLDMLDYLRSRRSAYVFTVLRNPSERILSNIIYLWRPKHRETSLSHLSFPEIVDLAYRERKADWAGVLANRCTRMLSGSISPAFFVGGDGRPYVDRARNTLFSFDYFGDVSSLRDTIATVLNVNGLPASVETAYINESHRDLPDGYGLEMINEKFADCLHMDAALWRSLRTGD
jgi:hypothetical protein